MISFITPDWPAPANVKALCTTRDGGVSEGPYRSLNLGDHVEDAVTNVEKNRQLLQQAAHLPTEPTWLQQVHGTDVALLTELPLTNNRFDAAYSRLAEKICTIMTADCLPVLFCAQNGSEVAAAHAGWRGLCDGILENTLAQFQSNPEQVLIWFGPAIGPERFEVGAEVRQAFISHDPQAEQAFMAQPEGKYLANIYLLAQQRLIKAGVNSANIYGGDFCTVTDEQRFFSYRRNKQTGRMASLIWFER